MAYKNKSNSKASPKAASFTWENINEPAPVTITSNSRLTPDILTIIGDIIPAAVAIVTVADPAATRIKLETEKTRMSGESARLSDISQLMLQHRSQSRLT